MSLVVDTFNKILQLPNLLTSGDSGLRGKKGPSGITVPVIAPNIPQAGTTIQLSGTVSNGVGMEIYDNEKPLRGTYRNDDDAISTTQEMASWVADEINRLEGISGWDFTNEGRTWYYIATATGNNINIKRSDNQPVQIQVNAYDSTFTATVTNQEREIRTGVKQDKGYIYLFLNNAWKELELEAVNDLVARPVLLSSNQLQITFWGSVENLNYENIEVFSGDEKVLSSSLSSTSNELTSVLKWNAENPFTDDLRIVYPSNLPEDRVSYTTFVESTLSALEPGDRADLSITGTVTYIDISGGFYGVVGDDGSKYVVVNEELKDRDKQRITITGYSKPDIVTIFMWGKPIWASQIIDAEEEEEKEEEEEEEEKEEEEEEEEKEEEEEEEEAPLANVNLSDYVQEKVDGDDYWNIRRITSIQSTGIIVNNDGIPYNWSKDSNTYISNKVHLRVLVENENTYIVTHFYKDDDGSEFGASRLRLRPRQNTDIVAPLTNDILATYSQQNVVQDNTGNYWETRSITEIRPEYIKVTTTQSGYNSFYIWNNKDAYVIPLAVNDLSIKIEVTSQGDKYILSKTGSPPPGKLELVPN